ncbi:MAG: hypothetical protein EAZ74_05955 [Alphaproteobacteria bacterium]|nr:MAG: hypothetical protein EAZ74_05955 [Alphaproteobacteria bacterium]TAF75475.1 MAG: hypothetical protein EAZ52_06510 [Alphaproteobacteria bacterium]
MAINKYTGKEEYIAYDDGTSVLLDEDDSPPFTEEEWENAPKIKASDLLPPAFFKVLEEKRVGRPAKPDKRKQVSIRLDPDLLEAFKATGAGWQTRINEILRQNMPK